MKHISSHKIICWQLTRFCNRQCLFCISRSSPKNKHPKRLLKFSLNQLKELGTEKISYSGGEPFLYPEIDYLIIEGSKMGFTQIVTTNGDIELKKRSHLLNIFEYIKISFYGNEIVHDKIIEKGHYKKIKILINWLLSREIRVGANYLLTGLSLSCIHDFLNDFKGLLDNVMIQTYLPLGIQKTDELFRINENAELLSLVRNVKNYSNHFKNGIKIHDNSNLSHTIILDTNDCFIFNKHGSDAYYTLGHINSPFLKLPNGMRLPTNDALNYLWEYRRNSHSIITIDA